MASKEVQQNIQKIGPQSSVLNGEGTRPQLSSTRKSVRLQRRKERSVSTEMKTKPKHPSPSLTNNTPNKEFSPAQDRKRKRELFKEDEAPLPSTATLSQKRPRTSPVQSPLEDAIGNVVDSNREEIDPIDYWRKELRWPQEYFEPECNMNYLLARKKSTSKQSAVASRCQHTGAFKSIPYARSSYQAALAKRDSFMHKFKEGITKASDEICQNLLSSEQTYPQDSLFRDDLFDITCENIENRNEAMVIRDISQLIVPSAQTLATYGATHLRNLAESVNESWNCARPIYGPRPQPDYSVGFSRAAFSENQLKKLEPFTGEDLETFTSLFMATWRIYFPFLTCEVKCDSGLNVADRQNAHSMTIALKGYVELFKLVKRGKELHQEILAFSISFNNQIVRIYGHYPVIEEDKTQFYRHPIDEFSLRALGGQAKWRAYKFTKNLYDIWMPAHLKRICSAIDELPFINLPQQTEAGESELSRGLQSRDFFSSDDSLASHSSVSEQVEGRTQKNARKRGLPAELHQN